MTSDITGATNNGITDSDLCSSSEETGSSSQTIDIYQSTESTKKVSPVDNNEELEVIPRPTNSDRTGRPL